jgi:hypothetical protein
MSDKVKVEVFIVMDTGGDVAVGLDSDHATERFDEEVGGSGQRRIVKLTVWMAPPDEVEEGPEVDVPDNAGKMIDPIEATAE